MRYRVPWGLLGLQQAHSTRSISIVPTIVHSSPLNSVPQVASQEHAQGSLSHYFDTFHIVTRLEAAGFQHGQAVSTMKAIRALLINYTESAKAETLSKADLENVRCRE